MDSDEPNDRRRWRLNLFGAIGEISDSDYQASTWLDPEMRNPHFTPVEFVEGFYDLSTGSHESVDPEGEDAPFAFPLKNGRLGPEERDALWPIHLALADFDPQDWNDAKAILADPAWRAVVDASIASKLKLLDVIDNPEERRAFETSLPASDRKNWL